MHLAFLSDAFNWSLNLNENANSHLLKNSEWGAVIYLAHSQYGRNGTEISENNFEDADGNPYTGGADGLNNTNYINNGNQTTTGNAYGVYDLNGGHAEYAAAYVNDTTDYSGNLERVGRELYTSTDNKYKNVYIKSESGTPSDNYMENSEVWGDAVYETSKSSNYSDSNTAWFSCASLFPMGFDPFFTRNNCSFRCNTRSAAICSELPRIVNSKIKKKKKHSFKN